AHARDLEQRIDDAGETGGREERAWPVERSRLRPTPALGDLAQRDRDDGSGEREIDHERPAPREMVDQPAAEDRADRGGHRAEPGPGPDGPAPLLLVERGRENREASGHEERAADSLDAAERDENPDARRE